MKSNKRVLIVFDGSPELARAASALATSLKGVECVVKKASEIVPPDLLVPEAYFFGCEVSAPVAFAEVERVLKGINLAGRNCGLFSLASEEAISYLRTIVRDADLRLHPKAYLASGPADLGAWAAETLRLR